MKLKESTSIPVSWVLAAYVPTTGFLITAIWWIFTVDSRLERIEHKLGIENPVAIKAIAEVKAAEK